MSDLWAVCRCALLPSPGLQQLGLKVGDWLISVSGNDVRYSLHDEVVKMVKESGDELELEVVTPEPTETRTTPPL